MSIKLFDSELKVMEVLWVQGELPAGKVAKILKDGIGWNRNTTYTVLKKCIEKGAVERTDPGFYCRALIGRDQALQAQTDELIDKMYGGSTEKFFAAMLNGRKLSSDEIERLKQIVDQMK